jgi:HEAT repeat protein
MKNRLYLVGGALLVAAVCWAGWRALGPLPPEVPEPVYDGKPLGYWLTDGSYLPPGLTNDSNAVPFLIRAVRTDSWFGATIYRKQVWPKLPASIQKRLPPPPVGNPLNTRLHAVEVLGRMGAMAKPAVPALIRVLKEDDNYYIRCNAAFDVAYLGDTKDDSTVTMALVQALRRDEDVRVRLAVVRFMDLTGRGSKAVVVALSGALKDKDTRVRSEAALALSRCMGEGKADRSVVTALTLALNSKDSEVRLAATNALLKLDPGFAAKAGISIPTLIRSLTNANTPARQVAAFQLGHIGQGNQDVVVALTEALKDQDAGVRFNATNSLLKLDSAAAAKAGIKMPSR